MATIIAVGLVVNGAILYLLPSISRRDILFAVTIDSRTRDEPAARAAIVRYRLAVWLSTIVGFGLVAGASSGRFVVVAPILQTLIVVAVWLRARRALTPFAVLPGQARIASLAVRPEQVPGGTLLAAGPLVILGVVALLVFLNWERIPERFPFHWTADGTPNRWRTKSVGSVFGPLAMGLIVVGVMLVTATSILRRTRQVAASGQAALSEWHYKSGHAVYTIASSYLAALVFSYVAVRPLVRPDDRLGIGLWLILGAIVTSAGAFTMWLVREGQGGQRRLSHVAPDGPPLGDGTPDHAWKGGGLIYFNRADPALLVEKRMGLGWTLNFGNKWAWLLLLMAFGVLPLVTMLSR